MKTFCTIFAFFFLIGFTSFSMAQTVWTKYEENPVLSPGSAGSWDDVLIAFPSVLFDGSTYHMWYGNYNENPSCIGYAIAPSIMSVPGGYETIQAAIDSAGDGNLVIVDEGTYYENINFKGKAITVASQFYMDGDTSHISKTVIDGSQPSNPDSGSVVYMVSGEDTTSVLMGMTIINGTGTKGESTGSGVNFPIRGGGGILCFNSGGRFVWNKIIKNTLTAETKAFGGGFAAGDLGSNAWIILEENQIMNNMVNGADGAYGGGIGLACNGKIFNNTISNNSCIATASAANGGGIRGSNEVDDQRILFIENNTINHNFINGTGTPAENNWAATGGGISLWGRFKASILSNKISNNQLNSFNSGIRAGGGIYMYRSENGSEITNNIIFRNSASHGGGIRLLSNNAQIINNTIIDNEASSYGGGIYPENSNPVVLNTIVWGNEANSGSQIGGTASVRYSDIQGGWTGEGNIDAYPAFVDTSSRDYSLTESSPCVGAGIDSVWVGSIWFYCPTTDFYGKPRPHAIDDFVDMGAVESPYEKLDTGIRGRKDKFPLAFVLMQNYPNPFNPKTVISWQLAVGSHVELSIYNILGQKIETLLNRSMPAGYHEVGFNGENLASGIYLYRIDAGAWKDVKKMILLR